MLHLHHPFSCTNRPLNFLFQILIRMLQIYYMHDITDIFQFFQAHLTIRAVLTINLPVTMIIRGEPTYHIQIVITIFSIYSCSNNQFVSFHISCVCVKLFNHGLMLACYKTNCGGGRCNITSPFTRTCLCEDGFRNLLNSTTFPCYRQCT